MKIIQLLMVLLNVPPILLGSIAFFYFNKLNKLIKVKRGLILASSGIFLFVGYLFFILPWLLIGDEIIVMKKASYLFMTIALLALLYGVARIYKDWRGVIR